MGVKNLGGTLLNLDHRLAETMTSLLTDTNKTMMFYLPRHVTRWYYLCRCLALISHHFPHDDCWGLHHAQFIWIRNGVAHAHDANIIYTRGIWRSLVPLPAGVTLSNTLFIIMDEGVISIQTSTKVLASKCIFQRAMIITDPLLNIRISWFFSSKVLNCGLK